MPCTISDIKLILTFYMPLKKSANIVKINANKVIFKVQDKLFQTKK